MRNLYLANQAAIIAMVFTSLASGRRSTVIAAQKSRPVPGPHQVYGFLTTAPNAIVEPVHPKAMPVKPTHRRGAGRSNARRSLPDDALGIGRCMRSRLSGAGKHAL
jgi:hypothetical protein